VRCFPALTWTRIDSVFQAAFSCLTRSMDRRMKQKKKGRKKNTALVICRDRKQFWTTQRQFWQWVREGIVIKTGDQPLTGTFVREHEELMVVLSNTVLDLAHPNHLRDAMMSRRMALGH
jgi:hypothetical protein